MTLINDAICIAWWGLSLCDWIKSTNTAVILEQFIWGQDGARYFYFYFISVRIHKTGEEVCIYDQLIIIKRASITHWHSGRINHDRPSDMETYVIKKWNIAAVIMNKISSLLWCVGCGLQLLRYRHSYLHPFLWMIYSFVGKCDETCSSYILKDIRNFLVCVVAAILVIINDILRINNITVPIFVTLWMICYHGNGRVVLPFVINQIQITFITNTIYSLAA